MPFFQTSLIHNKEEDILHFGAFKIRVIGAGNLDSQFFDLNSLNNEMLTAIVMQETTEDEPVVLANFNTQRAMLKFSTNEIDEIFDITRIILYTRKLWTCYSG